MPISKLPLALFATFSGVFGAVASIFYVKAEESREKQLSIIKPILPVIITTWATDGYEKAPDFAWKALMETGNRLDAIEAGCSACEIIQCDGVGFGGSPDESGNTTLDAMIFDGPTHNMGAVGGLQRIKNAIGVARAVMTYTKHSFLIGESATKFAKEMGFKEESLITDQSREMWEKWVASNCQPNYRQNVVPDPKNSCGPYKPDKIKRKEVRKGFDPHTWPENHDTIGMIVVDSNGDISCGSSTNGKKNKIVGRMGDSPIPGTGDGDVMMQFLPSYQAVEYLRQGVKDPDEACEKALQRIREKYEKFRYAIILATKDGRFGAACHGMGTFPFTVRRANPDNVEIITVKCIDS